MAGIGDYVKKKAKKAGKAAISPLKKLKGAGQKPFEKLVKKTVGRPFEEVAEKLKTPPTTPTKKKRRSR